MELLKKLEIKPSLKYSPRKMEMAIENGIDMIRAKTEVINVPHRKGRAPNFSRVGSQCLLMKKPTPKVLIDGIEAIKSVKNMASKRTIIDSPDMKIILVNLFSDLSVFVIFKLFKYGYAIIGHGFYNLLGSSTCLFWKF